MDDRDKKIIEHAIWALLLAWFSYMFFYQNLLLYRWHRGLPLPSKWPFMAAGIFVGLAYFLYKWENEPASQRIPEKGEEIKS